MNCIVFNYAKLRILVSMVILSTMVTTVKQQVQLWDPLLHEYDCITHENSVVSMVTKLNL
jgi:hypothetical protein